MNVKIDTKEKFTVITPDEEEIPANMTGDLGEMLLKNLQMAVPHIVLNLENVREISERAARKIAEIQSVYYKQNSSFVISNIQLQPKQLMSELGLLSEMNTTPSLSEAWDIIQMEEIERELMRDMDDPGAGN